MILEVEGKLPSYQGQKCLKMGLMVVVMKVLKVKEVKVDDEVAWGHLLVNINHLDLRVNMVDENRLEVGWVYKGSYRPSR